MGSDFSVSQTQFPLPPLLDSTGDSTFSALRRHGVGDMRVDVAQRMMRGQQDANPTGVAHDGCTDLHHRQLLAQRLLRADLAKGMYRLGTDKDAALEIQFRGYLH